MTHHNIKNNFWAKTIGLIAFLAVIACNNTTENTKDTKTTKSQTKKINPKTTKSSSQIAPKKFDSLEKIQSFLYQKYKSDIDQGFLEASNRQFSYYEVDLNDDGKNEYFIQLEGNYFCGSGGCSIYLLNNDFTKNTYFTVTEPPIFVSSKKTNNWHDLIIEGDYDPNQGIINYIHLKYNKTTGSYPSNPSVLEKINIAPSGHDFVMWHDEFSIAKSSSF